MAGPLTRQFTFIVILWFCVICFCMSFTGALEADSESSNNNNNSNSNINISNDINNGNTSTSDGTIYFGPEIATGLTTAGKNKTAANKMLLGVYYESRCPDSKRFFLSQLIPTYRQIGAIIKTQLVPFGHARTLGNNKMVCQHGPRECEGNKLMACVQERAGSDEAKVIETIGCLFGGQESDRECIKKHLPSVGFDDVEKCKTSDESYKLMEKYEQLTGRVDYVPKLTLNGEYSEEIQTECEHDLKNFLCRLYDGTKPDSCANQSGEQQQQ